MRYIIILLFFFSFLKADILETGIVGLSNDNISISSSAELYSYLNKIGNKALINEYAQTAIPLNRLDNPHISMANVKTYEDAFKNLRFFYRALYDTDSPENFGNKEAGLIKKKNEIIQTLLEAKRKQFNEETIVLLVIRYLENQKNIDILNLDKEKMYETATIIVKRILKNEYEFETPKENLLKQIDTLSSKDANNTTTQIGKLILEYKLQFIDVITKLQATKQNNSWDSDAGIEFLIKSNSVLSDANSSNIENKALMAELNKTIEAAKTDDKIIKIIFHKYAQKDEFYGIKNQILQFYANFRSVQDYTIFVFNNNAIQILDIVKFIEVLIAVLLIEIVAIFIINRKMKYGMAHISIFISKLLGVLYITYYLATSVLGLDSTNLAMFASAFSIAIGFGMQNIIQNFIAGIILIGDKTIQVGDKIVIGNGQVGIVESITYRVTTVRTYDNTIVMIPNSKAFLEMLENQTKNDDKLRLRARVLVPNNSNIKELEEIIAKAYCNIPSYVEGLSPKVAIRDMNDAGIVLDIRAFISDARVCDNETASRIFYDAIQAAGKAVISKS